MAAAHERWSGGGERVSQVRAVNSVHVYMHARPYILCQQLESIMQVASRALCWIVCVLCVWPTSVASNQH